MAPAKADDRSDHGFRTWHLLLEHRGFHATQWSWLPLDGLIAYMEQAKQIYGADDPDFFRKIGRYGALGYRSRPIAMIASDPASASEYAGTLWRLLFDSGDVEVVQPAGAGTRIRIRGFPAHAALCQRILGSLEGIYAAAQRPARVDKPACVLAGQPYCEFRIVTV